MFSKIKEFFSKIFPCFNNESGPVVACNVCDFSSGQHNEGDPCPKDGCTGILELESSPKAS